MAFKFPFTNYHELNLTWVLDQLKSLFEKSEENVTTIETYEGRLTSLETEVTTVSETVTEARQEATAATSLAQTAKITADNANDNAFSALTSTNFLTERVINVETEQSAIREQFSRLEGQVMNFDGRITQAERDANAANNAATIAQSIAREKADKTIYQTVSGTVVNLTGVDNTIYLCDTLSELTFTAPATGQTAIRFTSGTTPAIVTFIGVTMPDDWPTTLDASTIYEINVLNGLGVWQSWT